MESIARIKAQDRFKADVEVNKYQNRKGAPWRTTLRMPSGAAEAWEPAQGNKCRIEKVEDYSQR
jgi:hypothetical protein